MTLYAEKLLPHDIEAEEAVIGSLLIDGECFVRLAPVLQSADFYRERNSVCYDAADALFQRGQAIDQTTLAGELARTEKLETVGGMAYLSHLVAVTPTSAHAEDYAEIVLRTSTMRKLIAAAARISELGYNDTGDVDATMRQAQDILMSIERPGGSGLVSLQGMFDRYLEEEETTKETQFEVMSGLHSLDNLTGGMVPGDVMVIGARPAMGKSILALQMGVNAASNGMTVCLMSLELGWREIAVRLLSSATGINGMWLRRGLYTESQYSDIIDAIGRLSALPMYIGECQVHTLPDVRAKARRLSNEHGLNLLIIDYLQLMGGVGRRAANRVEELSEITRGIKLLAQDLGCAVVCCSQLNRQVEGRQDHRPVSSDLRSSGSIEQDADTVVLLHREAMYGGDPGLADSYPYHPHPERLAELIVSKNRHGSPGVAVCDFQGDVGRFENV